MLYFLATGRFEVYDKDGNPLLPDRFINKIFKVEYRDNIISVIADKARRSARMKMYLKYGKGIKLRWVFDVVIKRHSGIRKNKKRNA